MPQTELMLRLIRYNKIVGYEKHFRGQDGSHQIFHSKKISERGKNINWNYSDIGLSGKILADSFELGVKVMDDYWFAGDTGVDRGGYGDRFVLEFDGVKFKLTFEDANLNMDVFIINNLVDCKKTGNIHDIQHP